MKGGKCQPFKRGAILFKPDLNFAAVANAREAFWSDSNHIYAEQDYRSVDNSVPLTLNPLSQTANIQQTTLKIFRTQYGNPLSLKELVSIYRRYEQSKYKIAFLVQKPGL